MSGDDVVVAGIALDRNDLADFIESGALGRMLDDKRAPASRRRAFSADRWLMAARRLRDPGNCPLSSVEADNSRSGFWTPVALMTLTEWVSRGPGGQGVDPRTARRWASEGRLPIFTHHGKRYTRADAKRPHDQRRNGNG